jgi:hypothetical protein
MKMTETKKNILWGLAALLVVAGLAWGRGKDKDAIGADQRVAPKALAEELAATPAAKQPLLLHVGFPMLYRQGHIPGSVYAGAGNSAEGMEKLSGILKGQPKDRALVIYCGCCPWSRCPNVAPAFNKAKALGFTNIKVLVINENLGRDWADQGYPLVAGE